MAKPSLKASSTGLSTAKAELQRAGLTQQALRAQVGCSRQPMTNFFKGAAIAQPLFMAICEQLGLDWQAIADLPPSPGPISAPISTSSSAPSSTMAVPGATRSQTAPRQDNLATAPTLLYPANPPVMSPRISPDASLLAPPAVAPTALVTAPLAAPLALAQLDHCDFPEGRHIRDQVRDYTLQRCGNVGLLGRSQGRELAAIAPQLKLLNGSDLYRLNPSDEEPGDRSATLIAGEAAVRRYPYLHILGAPGAGKSTFLKYLALRCIQGALEPQRVPIFIALRDIASDLKDKSLFEAIAATYQQTCQVEPATLRQLFEAGQVLLLLDGEDEVAEDLSKQLVLTNFNLFYRNHVVITCRTAAHQRLHRDFVQATIEPFNYGQIQAFLDQWFGPNQQRKADFLDWLNQIQAETRQGYELAETPLLLTLLCLTFENSSSLPQGKLQIYELAFESLLDDWNSNHMTPWSSPFEQRSHGEKMRVLKAIARAGFSQREKRFSATRRFLAQAQLTPQDLDGLSAKDFLNDIERLYGLIQQEGWNSYRFSHLSFHEYLMALSILEQLEQSDPPEALLQDLLRQHLFERDWYEVFCFVIEGLAANQALPCLALLADQLQDYLSQQNATAQEQIQAGRAIAQALIDLYQTSADSPDRARQALSQTPSEAALVIRAFCSDYHYRFDLGRRISHAIPLDYPFNHDLVLAHCFKCNLNRQTKDQLKAGEAFVFSDALTHVWNTPELHQAIQAVETVTEVRDLFFNYVLQHPEIFRAEVCDRFQDYAQKLNASAQELGVIEQQSPSGIAPQTRQAISALVGEVSQPEQERHPFLQSEQLQFPTLAYADPTAIAALQNYYNGCTLLCDGLRSRPDISSEQRQALLKKLF